MKLLSEEFLSKYRGQTPKNAGVLFYPVYLRTYSRWLPDLNRRERWDETVERVVEYSMSLYQGPTCAENLIIEAKELYDHIFNLKVLPAGRTLWVGGTESSRKFPESQYNCSFVSIDSLEAFTDLFHLLLCGCGVGFRVLEEDVMNLPDFPPQRTLSIQEYTPKKEGWDKTTVGHDYEFKHSTIRVGDSREGWVESLNQFLFACLFGHSITMIFDDVRPKGERIKTFGGHAPGPEGLMEMFRSIYMIISKSPRLSPVDCMDICNLIGKNVIVGGTRRSSQIALGSPQDKEFLDAKKDLWKTKENLHRTMSNNTVVFEERPSFEKIQEIFQGIRNNGEPGFLNIGNARRRRPNMQGINPCLTADTWINTSIGPRKVKDLLDSPYIAKIHSEYRNATPFWGTGIKDVYKLVTKEGYEVNLTSNHKVLTEKGWKEAGNLVEGDKVILGDSSSSEVFWEGKGSFEEGWMLGSMVGDGTYLSDTQATMRFWGESQSEMSEMAFSYMEKELSFRSDCKVKIHKANKTSSVGCTALASLALEFGLSRGDKVVITEEIEKASSEFYRGFLSGIFDADGSVQGTIDKGRSVRLSQSNPKFLQGIQRMLLRLGVKSVLHVGRKEAGYSSMPDGHGGSKDYFCKAMNELIISRTSMQVFHKRIGFKEPKKKERLNNYFVNQKRGTYKDKFIATFKSLDYLGQEEVYDCTVEDLHRFEANGIIVHNCAEILMDSRGFCNLATVNWKAFVDRGYLNIYGLERAVRLATRITARMTNVTVSLPKWDFIQKRDRLLGVSMTGLIDALDAIGLEFDSHEAVIIYQSLAEAALDESESYADEMGIPRPLLVTTIKPEGTLSQLPTVSSGLHRAYAPYYIRRIRMSDMDPTCKALQRLGVPNEPDQGKKERIVFSFPIKTDAKIAASDEPAIDQFRRYLLLMDKYVDHNASCTLTIGEDEWEEIEKAVYDNFDSMVACAFLPKYTNAYPQMPYEEITKEQYEEMVKTFPDLTPLPELVNMYEIGEFEDELEDECKGGACPIR